jgi:ABC-2 type transport system permease protein
MATDVRSQIAGAPYGHIPLTRRLAGYGTVFGKTVRDSRRATIAVGVGLGLVLIAVSTAIVAEFATPESRRELASVVAAVPPILQGLAGKPVNVETLGGYLQYKYGTFFPLVVSLWSILALSGTLASEARRGSLEFVAAGPLSRRRIAVEKLLGHVTSLVIAMALIFVATAVAGSAVAKLPGDALSPVAAGGYAIWLGLLALAAGSVAFALAPILGRGSAAGIAGAITFGGFLLNGYQGAIPQLAPFANLTWFGWTSDHLPLAGQFDWAPLSLVAVVAFVLFVVGIEAFARRDIAATSTIPWPGLPDRLAGIHGPAGRTARENLPTALAWGIGLGLFGLLIAGSGRSFVEQLGSAPAFAKLLGDLFPGIDIGTVGGFLQLLFVEFGLVLAGLAAATLVAGWASDESSGRLEFLLATPRDRVRWLVSGALGIGSGIVVISVLCAVGIGIGTAMSGGDLIAPMAGSLVLGLYALALGGIGVAIGGLVGPSAAAPSIVILTILTWLLDIIGPALGLPDAVAELALSSHFGLPMVGVWDGTGIAACLILAVAGVLVGAWGFARRDLTG